VPADRAGDRQRAAAAAPATERGITECDYGDWQGRPLQDLAKEPLWKTVQTQPSAAAFPGGESMAAMQARAVAAVRRLDALVRGRARPGAVWVAVSHGDIIKSVLADALGMHLDLFQRIQVDPASVSIVRYTEPGPTCWPPTPTPATCPGSAAAAQGRRARPRTRRGGGRRRRPSAGPRAARCEHAADPRIRPAGALRRRHRRPARAAHVLPAGARRRPVTSVALEKQQVRRSPSGSTSCSTR
jgi:hypothetical protein